MSYLGGPLGPRGPAPAQFALRIATLGTLALVMFSIIFFRLWYLEVLSADEYLGQAQANRVREVEVRAPRGEIIDRQGRVLVDSRAALDLQVLPTELPDGRRRARVLERLGDAAGMSPEQIRGEIRKQRRELPSSPVTLARDVEHSLVYYLKENQARFPGVRVERVYVRSYPHGTLAAHLFGNVGEVTGEQLSEPRFEGLEPGDLVGQTGVEQTYDHVLRGSSGATRVQVDALGQPVGGRIHTVEPRTGNTLRLGLDARVQGAGEEALGSFGLPGAFVAMDVDTGEVLAMGSRPTFDPTVFTQPRLPQSTFEELTSEENGAPLANRAIQGLYPTGSTFKLITATAGLEAGLIGPEEIVVDTGTLDIGNPEPLTNAGGASYGPIDMVDALRVSSDIYFYKLGVEANEADPDGGPIQEWAKRLGLGSRTGIDIPAEASGLVPTPGWRNELYAEAADPDSPGGSDRVFELGETDRPWSIGDNVNLSVGQGDLQADPLQMAVAYAAIGNGGEIVRPHLGLRVEDPRGRVVQEIAPAPRRTVDVSARTREAIMEGLRQAAMEPGGTSYGIFGGWPVQIAGKTGTAERPPHGDQSWYVALAPYDDPEVVVAVTIEEAGFGAEAAAPAAAEILQPLLEVRPRQIDPVAVATGVYE